MYSIGSGRYQIVAWGYVVGLFLPVPFYLLHRRFPKLRLNTINTAIILGYVGALSHGTHSGMLIKFALGFFAQLYLRKYRPNWFVKYNYILSAGLDGGTSMINFILTFTVFGGGAMKAKKFPPYWGNNWQKGMNLEVEGSCCLCLCSGFSGNEARYKLTSSSGYTNKERPHVPTSP
jgi:hypothetical protein